MTGCPTLCVSLFILVVFPVFTQQQFLPPSFQRFPGQLLVLPGAHNDAPGSASVDLYVSENCTSLHLASAGNLLYSHRVATM